MKIVDSDEILLYISDENDMENCRKRVCGTLGQQSGILSVTCPDDAANLLCITYDQSLLTTGNILNITDTLGYHTEFVDA